MARRGIAVYPALPYDKVSAFDPPNSARHKAWGAKKSTLVMRDEDKSPPFLYFAPDNASLSLDENGDVVVTLAGHEQGLRLMDLVSADGRLTKWEYGSVRERNDGDSWIGLWDLEYRLGAVSEGDLAQGDPNQAHYKTVDYGLTHAELFYRPTVGVKVAAFSMIPDTDQTAIHIRVDYDPLQDFAPTLLYNLRAGTEPRRPGSAEATNAFIAIMQDEARRFYQEVMSTL